VGGESMASLVAKPDLIEFFNHISLEDTDINIEEVTYEDLPKKYQGESIKSMNIRWETGCTIIGIKTADEQYFINPDPETSLKEGIKLFFLGTAEQIRKLKDIHF
ncbi:MAG: cation:proton antiporter regulatory subunit, partial [Flavobacteriales bacterium]